MNRSIAASYRESEILTAPPGRLLIITYDALLASMARARVGLELQNREVVHSGLDRSRALLGELLATLDRNAGSDLADRLAALYVFLLGELDGISLRGDAARLARHIGIVRELRDAYATIVGRVPEPVS